MDMVQALGVIILLAFIGVLAWGVVFLSENQPADLGPVLKDDTDLPSDYKPGLDVYSPEVE